MSITAKSVIFDIATNHGSVDFIGVRAIDFWLSGSKITVSPSTCAAYSTTSLSSSYVAIYAFDTSKSKTGSWNNTNTWLSSSGNNINQRLIIVFNTATEFDAIKINNAHHNGSYTDDGANNVKIHVSTDEITSTVYDEAISNSTLIYNSTFDQHVASNVEDEQTLVLTGATTYTVTYDGNTNDSGTVPTDTASYSEGDTVTVLGNTGSLAKTGYTFAGWNTAANGTGTTYAPNDTFLMGNANVTLYAVWTEDSILPVLYLGATKITKIYKGATEITNFIRT